MPTQRRTAKSAKKSSAKKSSAKSASKSRSSSRSTAAKQSRGRSGTAKTGARSAARGGSSRGSSSGGRGRSASGSSRSRRSATPNAIDLLSEDHRNVQKMFRRAERLEASDPKLQEIVQTACAALTLHAEIEEELLYPALEQEAPDTIAEAHVEHDVAKQLIAELQQMSGGDDQYKATFKVLGEYVNHHVEEEESQVFRAARRAKLDLEAIGEQILARKEAAAGEEGGGRRQSGGRAGEGGGERGGRGGSRSSRSSGGSRSSRGSSGQSRTAAPGGETESTDADDLGETETVVTGGDTADESERPGRGGRDRLEASGDADAPELRAAPSAGLDSPYDAG